MNAEQETVSNSNLCSGCQHLIADPQGRAKWQNALKQGIGQALAS